jgi:hypothetical protein
MMIFNDKSAEGVEKKKMLRGEIGDREIRDREIGRLGRRWGAWSVVWKAVRKVVGSMTKNA